MNLLSQAQFNQIRSQIYLSILILFFFLEAVTALCHKHENLTCDQFSFRWKKKGKKLAVQSIKCQKRFALEADVKWLLRIQVDWSCF